ncbi:MAG: hypothetical protein H6701_10720 [Myxococcales bacterium]|nr:hypothetical protein [Myxococcales bacterium]
MRDEYGFDGMTPRKNPYARRLTKQITSRIERPQDDPPSHLDAMGRTAVETPATEREMP